MRTFNLALTLVILASLLASKSSGLTLTQKPTNPGAVTLIYDPSTGNYSLNGGGEKITTWEHKDAGGLFNCDNLSDGTLPGLFDVCNGDKLFKLDSEGFESIDFGNILPLGMGPDEVMGIGAIGGSMLPDGSLDRNDPNSPYLLWIPEPSSMTILVLGLMGMLGICRRRS